MGNFNLDDYEPVQSRIPKFYEVHPDGRIVTSLHSAEAGLYVFKATLYKSGEEQERGIILTTGWAQEQAGQGFVNKTSALENCETSAIGRALANIGLHGDKRPSREEMQKVQNGQKQKPKGDFNAAKAAISSADKAGLVKITSGIQQRAWAPDEAEQLEILIDIRKDELSIIGGGE